MSVRPTQERVLPRSVFIVAGVAVVVLLALAQAYGFHRDELYFVIAGRRPDLGYVDQPPLTPLLSAWAVSLLGLQPIALRILPALAVGGCIVAAGLLAGFAGGGRTAQVLAAILVAVSGYLGAGHLGVTATYDLLFWAVLLVLAARILAGGGRWLWVAAGVVAGLALQDKHTVLFLLAGLVVGTLVDRRDLLRSPWPWVGGVIALAIWAPNLWWQAANGFPQLAMASAIASDGLGGRAKSVLELVLLMGPCTFPVGIVGLVRLLRDPAFRPLRPLGTASVVVLLLVLASGGKSYYAVGVLPALVAVGAVPLSVWLQPTGGWSRRRVAPFALACAGSAAVVTILTLPVLPPAVLAETPIPSIYKEGAEQVGWDALARTVDAAVATLAPAQRENAVVLTGNYGEAGAISLLGTSGIPVYSGHNSLWSWGPPPASTDSVILVGWWSQPWWNGVLSSCRTVATVDNGVGLRNEEQGAPIQVCEADGTLWASAWPRFRHNN